MLRNIRLDSRGMEEILKRTQTRSVATAATDRIAAAVPDVQTHSGVAEIRVGYGETDRAKGYVTIAHAAGIGFEARHGYLAQAAAAAGLDTDEAARAGPSDAPPAHADHAARPRPEDRGALPEPLQIRLE